MAPALRRLPLEWALLVALPLTIVATAASATWSADVRSVAQPLRALGLLTVALLAVGVAATRRAFRLDSVVACCATVLLAMAAASTLWSVNPVHTLERVAGFGLVVVAAAAISAAFAGDPGGTRRLLLAIVGGAVAVALIGLAIAAISPDSAVQAATASVGERFRGLGQNPNTTAMLFAVAFPLAALWLVEARRPAKPLALAAVLLLGGSIIASASRGAAAAACLGLLVVAVAAPVRPAFRAAAVVGVALVALAAASVTAVSPPLSQAEVAQAAREHRYPVGSTERRTPNDAQYVVRLEDEIGYSSGTPNGRSRFSTSGRVEAWRGALRQAADRPVAGYGFGTEERVFVDRYQSFQGGVPENSFIGLLLQLGVVGLTVFVVLLGAVVAAAIRLFRREPTLVAAALGVVAAALVLSFVQSYLYIAGNTATLAVWVAALLPGGRTE